MLVIEFAFYCQYFKVGLEIGILVMSDDRIHVLGKYGQENVRHFKPVYEAQII